MSAKNNLIFTKSLLDRDLLYQFPKIELHRHLEGTFDIDTLYELSVKNDLDTPRERKSFREYCQFPKNHKPDFLLFLDKFHNNWYRSLDDVYQVIYRSVKNIKKEGLYYIELRFSPEHFALVNNFDRIEVTKIALEASRKAAEETDLQIQYLITFNRSKQTQDEMLSLYKKILDNDFPDIIGVDLAGDETNYPPELFKDFFSEVHKIGLHKIDIHAGEICDSQQIWTAINELYADRIGHGISSIYDKPLQKELKERQISLCQCLISNYQTNAWADSKNHPIGYNFTNNIPVSINSDDPTIQNADLVEDYYRIIENLGFTFQDLMEINLNTVDYSFLNSHEKKLLKKAYLKELKLFVEENS